MLPNPFASRRREAVGENPHHETAEEFKASMDRHMEKIEKLVATDKANHPLHVMRAAGWTDQTLIAAGYATDPNAPEPAAQVAPPVARNTVGAAVMNLHRALTANRNIAATLQAEIDAKTEAHRQTSAVVRAIELALLELEDDDALTEEERAIIVDIHDLKVAKALEAAEAEINSDV